MASRRSAVESLTVLVAHPGAQLYGADRVVLESIDAMVRSGWRVVMTAPSQGPLIGEVEARGAEVRVLATPVLRKAYLSPVGLLRLAMIGLTSLLPAIRLLRELRPDVVYVSTVTAPLWIVVSWMVRAPVVCHIHEAESTVPSLVRKGLSAPLLLTRRLVVNSRFCAQVVMGDWPRLSARIDLVYNGVPGPGDPPPPRASLEPPVRLLYVGRLSERKGVQDAVDAVGILCRRGIDVDLDIVGDAFSGYEWVVDDLTSRAAAAGVQSRVHLLGFDADVWPHLARTDVLLVPSRQDESFGNVVVEGALAARPVVVSHTSGMIEAADGLRAAIGVAPGVPDEIADGVQAIVERWESYRSFAIEDLPVVADRYSLERYRSAIAGVIESAAGRA